MFKKSVSMKLMQSNNSAIISKPMTDCDLTMQEKLEMILERPNYCQLRAAEDAAASDSE